MESQYNPRRNFLFHKPANFTLKMAPMIDMIFLLLIFFLVCAKWFPQEKLLPFSFPTAQAGEMPLIKAEPLLINIESFDDGCIVNVAAKNIKINNETIENDLVKLLGELNIVLKSQKRYISDPVKLTCDKSVKWDHFAKVYNVLYGVGMTDITIVMTHNYK
jgi:biopolymer transport protein ExbD